MSIFHHAFLLNGFFAAVVLVDFLRTAFGVDFFTTPLTTDFGDILGTVLGHFTPPKLKFASLRFTTVGLNGVVLLLLTCLGFFTCIKIKRYRIRIQR